MKAPLEKDIQAACLDYLRAIGGAPVRINSGAMQGDHKGKRWFFRFTSEEGCSDILCVLPGGRFGAVEVKRPGTRTDPVRLAKQQAFLAWVQGKGGFAAMVESADELRAALAADGYGPAR